LVVKCPECQRLDTVLVYDTPLTIDQALTLLAEQPKAIAELTAGLPRARLHRSPSPGEWSLNDELAHLRSCADMWGKYIATIVAEDRPTIRAINPTTWIKSTDYPELEFAPSLRAFSKQRAELLTVLRALPRGDWSRSATVTGAGTPRDRTVLEVRAVAGQPRAISPKAHRAHRHVAENRKTWDRYISSLSEE